MSRGRRLMLAGWLLLAGSGARPWVFGQVPEATRPGPASVLERPVRLAVGWWPLAQVLAEASRQSGAPISYSSTRLGTAHRVYVASGVARPLAVVLHEALGGPRANYGLLGGQVVLWPRQQAAPMGVTEVNGGGVIKTSETIVGPLVGKRYFAQSSQHFTTPMLAQPGSAKPGFTKADVAKPGPVKPGSTKSNSAKPGMAKSSDANLRLAKSNYAKPHLARPYSSKRIFTKEFSPSPALPKTIKTVPRNAAQSEGVALNDSTKRLSPQFVALNTQISPNPQTLAALPVRARVPAPAPMLHRLMQFSIFYPLSTNSLANARIINNISLNTVVGFAGGVEGGEVGGAANIVRDSVRGVQVAGALNVVGTETRGVQVAGLANLNGGSVFGIQVAGFANLVRDDVRGLQVAGVVNIVGGAAHARYRPNQPTRVRRWLGLPRLLATDPLAQLTVAPSTNARGPLVQAAAAFNLTGTDVRGLQTASVLNVARRVSGVQFGLINVARHVRGVQIGFINVADSVDGVALGLINIVRHGYLRGEIWASESLPLNAVVKLGVTRYYTILGAAAEPFGNRVAWAAGFGVGTAGRPHGRFTLSLDVVQWTLAGSADDPSNPVDARLLTQLRPALAWQMERDGHLQLVFSPTLNLAVAWSSDHQPEWDFGANQWLLIDTAGDQSRTRLWPGLQLGLRF